MGSTAQIIRADRPQMSEDECVSEFLEIIRPLGFLTKVESDNAIYMRPENDSEKGVRVWVDPEEGTIYSINAKKYYRTVFFDFIWDDERHGIEDMNSDMILSIVAEYMKKYPEALFDYEWSLGDSAFMDKTDIENVLLQPFKPDWFGTYKSHLNSRRLNDFYSEWILE